MKIFHIKLLSVIVVIGLFLQGCNEVLDKENLTAVNPSDVWSSASMAEAYLNNIYSALMPGNPGSTGESDEEVPYKRQTNSWFQGTATFDSWNAFGTYSTIRTINIFLGNIDGATFDETLKSQMKGQALFWRAWCYYSMVKGHGGVPLVLEAQQATDNLDELALPRSKTSECVTQIIKDLDDAAALLPDSWSGEDLGRIDKGVTLSFKGRVLLFFASPLFNGLGGVASWQKAYDANKAALDFLISRGNGLYYPFSGIWDNELNKEDIMIRRFAYPNATYQQNGIIPIEFSRNSVGINRPSLELVDAFPLKDGSKWDAATMSYDTLFKNRDDRFYASIYYNGSPNQYLADMKNRNTYLWTYFKTITDYYGASGLEGAHNSVTKDEIWSNSSFYRVKAVDKTVSLDKGTLEMSAVDWVEIRFAEVLMNYGECANELGKTSEALNVLYQIRNRAGIEPGANTDYGIKAASTNEIREAYKKERFVEFCFEGKRWDDLRRWKMFDYLRSLPQRHGVAVLLKQGETDVQPMDDINLVWNKFTTTVIKTDFKDIEIKDQYYYYGIPKSVLDQNAKLEQNNNWGGTFDPLQ